MVGVNLVNPLDRLAIRSLRAQAISHMDTANDQNTVLRLDLSPDLALEPSFTGIDPPRFQRAPEGTRQSPASGGHHVVKRGRMRFEAVRGDSVMLRYFSVNAEENRVLFRRKIGKPQWPAAPLDSDSRYIGNAQKRPPSLVFRM